MVIQICNTHTHTSISLVHCFNRCTARQCNAMKTTHAVGASIPKNPAIKNYIVLLFIILLQHWNRDKKTLCQFLPWDSIFWTGHVFTLIITIFVGSIIIAEKSICIWWLIAVALMIFRQQCINAKGFLCWNICLICWYRIGEILLISAHIVLYKTVAIGWRRQRPWRNRWRWHWIGVLRDDCVCF